MSVFQPPPILYQEVFQVPDGVGEGDHTRNDDGLPETDSADSSKDLAYSCPCYRAVVHLIQHFKYIHMYWQSPGLVLGETLS
jgi:hypothetical protein